MGRENFGVCALMKIIYLNMKLDKLCKSRVTLNIIPIAGLHDEELNVTVLRDNTGNVSQMSTFDMKFRWHSFGHLRQLFPYHSLQSGNISD